MQLFFPWKPEIAGREPMNVFSPRADPESSDPFLPEHPLVRMEQGKIQPVPFVTGFTEKEGIWRANALLPGKNMDKNVKQTADLTLIALLQ